MKNLSSSKQSSVAIAPMFPFQGLGNRPGGANDLPGSESQIRQNFSSSSSFVTVLSGLPADTWSKKQKQRALGLGELPGAKSWTLGLLLGRNGSLSQPTIPHNLWDLRSLTRIELEPTALKILSPNHWMAKEIPLLTF